LHDSTLIVLGLDDKTARIWGMNSHDSKVLPIDDDPNIDTGVTSVAISPNPRFVAVGSLDTVDCLCGHGDLVYWFCYW